jgi:hypothetical protein
MLVPGADAANQAKPAISEEASAALPIAPTDRRAPAIAERKHPATSVIKHMRKLQFQTSFDAYDPSDERPREALLALGNGVLLTRGCATDAVAGRYHRLRQAD